MAKHLVPRKHQAITIWPFVVIRSADLKNNLRLMNHEKIHIRQQVELLVIPFYIWYAAEFLIHLIKGVGRRQAYRRISFEKEAYQHESDYNYLNNRSFWRFLSFFRGKRQLLNPKK